MEKYSIEQMKKNFQATFACRDTIRKARQEAYESVYGKSPKQEDKNMSNIKFLSDGWIAISDGDINDDGNVIFRQIDTFTETGIDHILPMKIIKAYITELVRSERIKQIEQMTDDEILKLCKVNYATKKISQENNS